MNLSGIAARVASENSANAVFLPEMNGIFGIEIKFKGKTYFLDEPCNKEGRVRNYYERDGFMLEAITPNDGNREPVQRLKDFPNIHYASSDESDEYKCKVWFLLEDCDNYGDVIALQVHDELVTMDSFHLKLSP